MDIEGYVAAAIEDSIASTRKSKTFHMRLSWVLHIGAMVLGGAVTVLLGLQFAESSSTVSSRNAALLLSALGTLFAALLTFWDVDNFWLKRRMVLTQLEILQRKLDFARETTSQMSVDDVRLFFEEYLAILGEDMTYWEAVQSRFSAGPIKNRAQD